MKEDPTALETMTDEIRRAMRGCFGCRPVRQTPPQSFRDGPKDQTSDAQLRIGNLEIPGSMLRIAGDDEVIQIGLT
jgi:hypothetical protein